MLFVIVILRSMQASSKIRNSSICSLILYFVSCIVYIICEIIKNIKLGKKATILTDIQYHYHFLYYHIQTYVSYFLTEHTGSNFPHHLQSSKNHHVPCRVNTFENIFSVYTNSYGCF